MNAARWPLLKSMLFLCLSQKNVSSRGPCVHMSLSLLERGTFVREAFEFGW
jgi:hypothetical protein